EAGALELGHGGRERVGAGDVRRVHHGAAAARGDGALERLGQALTRGAVGAEDGEGAGPGAEGPAGQLGGAGVRAVDELERGGLAARDLILEHEERDAVAGGLLDRPLVTDTDDADHRLL